jgi:hypothetical protein
MSTLDDVARELRGKRKSYILRKILHGHEIINIKT